MTLGFLAFAWLLGIAAAAFSGADHWAALAAAAALAASSIAFRPRPGTLALLVAGTALIFAAAWRYDTTAPPPQPSDIARLNEGPQVTLRALISDEPDQRGGTVRYRLSVRELLVGDRWFPESGGVLMRSAPFPRYGYGDLVELTGELETPPSFDDFDYREYLARRGVGSLIAYPDVRPVARGQGSDLRAALIDIRGALSDSLASALPEPEASLAAGVLLGKRARLPSDLTDDMNATGTSHLVAVSGQNVALVAGLLIAALAWAVGRRPAAWLALAGIVGYSLLVGGEPSVVRAAIMGGLYVVAVALGRRTSGPIALALAGAVMAALDPQVVHDVSFQLSFAATFGLMTLAPLLSSRIETHVRRWPALHDLPLLRPLAELTSVTVAAIAFTLPITAINFQRVSLVAPLANLLAVPAFLAVAATGAVAAVIGSIFPAATDLLGWLAYPPAAYMVAVVQLAAEAPLASLEVRGLGTPHAIAYYAGLAAALWMLVRRPQERAAPVAPQFQPSVRSPLPAAGVALILALASALLWLAVATPESGRLSVTFLDVGQGDAILIEGPQGHRVLVDGGASEEAITSALGPRLPFYDRRIDLAVLTHPQADHLGGLPAVLDRYDVAAVLASPLEGDSALYRAWWDAVRGSSVPYYEAAAGQRVDLGEAASIHVLAAPEAPDDPNEGSVVVKVVMGQVSFLLTGDIGEKAETLLLRSPADLASTVYKVPHHGSAGSSSEDFLAAVHPIVDVISVGGGNRYGHPSPEVLERLDGAVFRTDLHGDVTVSTDGHRMWVETER